MVSNASDLVRTAILLGAMVLDEEGKPVGMDAILDASPQALAQLEQASAPFTEIQRGPLENKNASDTA